MKGWQIALAIFAGFFILVGILSTFDGEEGTRTDTERHQEANDSIPLDEEDEVPPVQEPRKTVTEIYNEVELGMSEEEVIAIAGEPDMTNEIEIEGLGTSKDLIYHLNEPGLDNVTITIENETVMMVILGEFDSDGDIHVKSKM